MYHPRHARPSCLPARAAVGTGLTAILLPLTTAAPAIAQEATPAPGETATSTSTIDSANPQQQTTMRISATPTGKDRTAGIGVRLLSGPDDTAVPDSEVSVQGLTGSGWQEIGRMTTNGQGLAYGHLPFERDTRIRAVYAGDVGRTPGVSPEVVVQYRAITSMRISATNAGSDGRARVGVRLLADGNAVRNGVVDVEAATSSGWKRIGRLSTDSSGLGVGSLPFSRDTRIRVNYPGSATRTAEVGPEAVVKANTLGQRAVQIAAQQAGKPYRYGAAGPSSFDCSGFTTYIYKTRLGKSIPRTSSQQAAALPRVAQSAKRPGDLLFFRSGGRVSHVAIYAGGGQMWDAPTSGNVVRKRAIYSSSYTVGRVS